MSKLYAIPDIHGRMDLLEQLLKKLLEEEQLDLSKDSLVFLGDMIDRGPRSKDVLDKIRELTEKHPKSVIALAGNHEWLAIDAMTQGYDEFYLWMLNGGNSTLESFGHNARDLGVLPTEYVKWMASLPLFYETKYFFFSHAPVENEDNRKSEFKGKPFSKNELIWTYHLPEGLYARNFPAKIGVCGHVHALRDGILRPRFYDHYIFADAGCGCSADAPLVAIEVNSEKVIYSCPDELNTPSELPSKHPESVL